MTTENFNLSGKRIEANLNDSSSAKYREEDVKEFIRLLKEFMYGNYAVEPVIIGKHGIKRYPIKEIDKLAGDKLST